MNEFKIEIPLKQRLDFVDMLSASGIDVDLEEAKKSNRYRVAVQNGASISREDLLAALEVTKGKLIEK